MKRALIIASVASMIDQFNMPNIRLLQELGYEVDVACNFIHGSTCSDERIAQLKETLKSMDVQCYQIDFARNVTKIGQNLKALKEIKELLRDKHYDLIHCHSPIGGLLTRFAAKKFRKSGTKVIYTAHGFHFFEGAPKKNWLIYYPIEKICSRWTDILITINKEDFELAKKKMKAKTVEYVPGIGIDADKFANTEINNEQKRAELGVPKNAFLLLSVGELNENKNHEIVINALKEIENPDIHYAIAGKGELKEHIEQLGFENVHLLGFRNDVDELYKVADLYVHPSFREGLSVALMEAIASGTAVIASDIRGNRDVVSQEKLFDPRNIEMAKEKILQELNRKGADNTENDKIISYIDIKNVRSMMEKIYNLQ